MKKVNVWLLGVFFALTCAISYGDEKESEKSDAVKEVTLILAGKLLVEAGEKVQEKVSVLVVGEQIQEIIPRFVDAADLTGFDKINTIDLRDRFVLPGLIDAHVHLLMLNNSDRPALVTEGQYALGGAYNAKLTLEAGFTTVRDLGAPGSSIFALRDAINEGRITGPRILAAGAAIAVTGGHGDTIGYNEKLWEHLTSSGVCDGVSECRKAVRTQIKRSADVIKITATGGGGKPQGGQDAEPEFFGDEFAAAVETAHRLEKKVAVHAHGTKGIQLALKAGVDSIEHGTFLDKETIQLFKKSSVYLVPTLSVRDNLKADIDEMPLAIRKRARYIVKITPKLMGDAHRKGVKIALGSDAGVVPHGNNARELEWLVEIGMTPQQALCAATVSAADLLGLKDKIGVIASGMHADIIAVDGDPLINISDIRNVSFVMKSGTIYRQN